MRWLIDLGYLGLFIGTFLAGTVLPLSSDFMLVGVLSLGADPWLCLPVATLGNWIGLLTTYSLGWLGKWEWLERWFGVKREKLESQRKIIDKFGLWIPIFTWLPLIGVAALVAMGFYKVKPRLTVLLLFLGCFLRFFVWTLLYVNYAEKFVNWIIDR